MSYIENFINHQPNPQTIMIEKTIERLRAYNKWRTGEDDRTMDEVGIQPSQLTADIKTVCDELEKLISMYASRN
jgi:hypothetical protein